MTIGQPPDPAPRTGPLGPVVGPVPTRKAEPAGPKFLREICGGYRLFEGPDGRLIVQAPLADAKKGTP